MPLRQAASGNNGGHIIPITTTTGTGTGSTETTGASGIIATGTMAIGIGSTATRMPRRGGMGTRTVQGKGSAGVRVIDTIAITGTITGMLGTDAIETDPRI